MTIFVPLPKLLTKLNKRPLSGHLSDRCKRKKRNGQENSLLMTIQVRSTSTPTHFWFADFFNQVEEEIDPEGDGDGEDYSPD